MLSAYEQERLNNIAKNKAFLDALGLGDDKPALIPKKKVTKRCHDDADDDEASAEPTRRSARVAKIDPEHGQLTDEFCIAERARTYPLETSKDRAGQGIQRNTGRRRCRTARGILATCFSQTQSFRRCRTATPSREATANHRDPTGEPDCDAAATGQHADCPPTRSACRQQCQAWCTLPCQRGDCRMPTLQWAIRAQEAEVLPCRTEMDAFRVQKAHMRQCPCHHAYWLMCVDYTSFCRIPSTRTKTAWRRSSNLVRLLCISE